ncbi:rhomboid family intramembrane serine protease [Convivina praedatoris]|uniref:Rhomboid protease GluP n=1 Tax=Convivina praedatoris TaxID=2880963 RepID=A0ABM9D1P3_9LACO|nr:rhomboid family intramembrane serine protease [Convivina sp. LMG 32447]CAH1850441.1 Rhomboid protease GluP [Convivina sp. LMG 32447]CAH1850454.1 Rhomboid protease GluP [Convivina sp. LMG 32447]CAH1850762.1 Rhomboid protease GluP [Convivina sp. LMG 32447]
MADFKKAPVTVIIAVMTILVFLVEILLSHGQPDNVFFLVKFGAKYGPYITQEHQYWRLLTPLLIHLSWSHLILNILTLWFLGLMIEPLFGSIRFLLIYLIGGLGGNLLSYWLAPQAISAGASSAIFGLLGALLIYIGYQGRHNSALKTQRQTFLVFVVLNLVGDLFTPSIDFWGHLGGLVSGMILAIVMFYQRRIQ